MAGFTSPIYMNSWSSLSWKKLDRFAPVIIWSNKVLSNRFVENLVGKIVVI